MCQPMVGKMMLPYFGGAANVWTTCVLFFQFMLLLGYVYAHLLARIRSLNAQILTHGIVLLFPLLVLPIQFTASSSEAFSLHPSLQLLLLLTTSTAIPFFVVSSSAPLLQNWFSRTTHSASADPYFLYAASNAGSLLALIAYPFILEPRIGAAAQSRLWFALYAGLILMFAISAAALYPRARSAFEERPRRRPALANRLYWIAAAFISYGLILRE